MEDVDGDVDGRCGWKMWMWMAVVGGWMKDAEVDVDSYWSPVLPRPDRNEMGLSETYCLTRDQLRNTLALFVKVWMSPNVSQNPKATTAMLGPASVVLGKMFSEEWLDPDVEVPTNLKSALGVQAVLF